MSLYDDAAVALIAEGAAGKDGVLYNIKPELEVHAEELTTNGDFATPGTATESSWSLGWATSGGSEGDTVISGGKLTLTNAGAEDRADAYMTDGSSAFFDLIDDETYYVTYNVTDNSDGAASILKVYAGSSNSYDVSADLGPQSVLVTQSGADNSLIFQMKSTDASITISNISVKRVKQASKDFTFTRGSNLTATRVGPDGLIEKGRENVLQNSNDFSIAASDGGWVKNDTTVTSGQSGYDGTTNAWKLSSTVSTSFNNIEQKSSDVPGITDYGDKVATFSVYLKKGNTDWARVNLNGTGNVYFDLSGDGAVGTVSSGNLLGEIEKVGFSGWFRCSVTRITGNSFTGVLVYVAASDGNLLATDHSESKHIFVQNAQLEYGLVATDYIESHSTKGTTGILEDSPRFDYTNVTCPHLLMEPTRINLVKNSEYLGDYTTSNATITTNALTSPEGRDNATTINVTSNSGSVYAQSGGQVAAVTASTKYTFSFYVKQGTNTENYLAVRDQSAEVFIDEDVAYTASSSEWKRIEHTFTTPAGCTSVRLYPSRYDSGGQGTTHLFGIQLEEGSYATSYIPNHGTSGGETRLYDTTDSLEFGDYMDGDDVTLFVDLAKNPELIRDGGAGEIRLSSSNKTAGSIKLYRSGDTNLRTVVYFADVELDNDPTSHIVTDGTSPNIAIRRVKSTGEFTVFYDGSQQYQAFNTNYDVLDNILIRGDDQPIFINSILLFDRALTDDECKALAT